MNNKEFANLLATAVENKKLNASKTVTNFIETHDGKANGKFSDPDGKYTPEIVKLVTTIRQKRMKVNDAQLNSIFNEVVETAPVEKKVVKTAGTGYRAQEW